MDQDITVMLCQKTCRLVAAHIVVGVDAADKLIFTFDSHDRDRQLGQFPGRDGVAQDDHALDLIGQKLLDVSVLNPFVGLSGKDQKFITKSLISGKDLV